MNFLDLDIQGMGIYASPTTFRQFSPDELIRGGSKYTKNLSFVIAEHLKLVSGKKNCLWRVVGRQSLVGS